jgi:hypothetical protein
LNIESNIPFIVGSILAKFAAIENPETVTRYVAANMMGVIRDRIHEDGKNSNGAMIGEYSSKYMKLRQSKYNRTADRKVIASLTRQLENSYTLKGQQKSYTIEVFGEENAKKIEWLEERYGNIWQLTEEERKIAIELAAEQADKIFKLNALDVQGLI